MPKKSTVFFCRECGYESPKWMGQCPSCKAWNTFSEEPIVKTERKPGVAQRPLFSEDKKAVCLEEVSMERHERLHTGFSELDRVLGGGIVPGSLLLVGGDPGIGKSTILLQVCRNLSEKNVRILYISGEESLQQIKMRAIRLGDFGASLKLASETNLETVEELIDREKPEVVIIDSIQTMFRDDVDSAPGSISQVRESTSTLLGIAKRDRISIFIIGHVTKEGTVAGPRMLEHMADTVLYFEGDRFRTYRIIRAVKNRFGATNEVGVFEMTEKGLREVLNPSDFLLEGRPVDASGSAVTCVLEGTRPVLLEIQALVAKTNFGLPRRTAVGFDQNRLNLLIAVMERRASVPMGEFDAYVNITGGMKVTEPAMDLAVVMALASGYYDIPIDPKTIVLGEVGLTGELRGCSNVNLRVKEAVKLGYERVIFPKANARSIDRELRKYCMPVNSIREGIRLLSKDQEGK